MSERESEQVPGKWLRNGATVYILEHAGQPHNGHPAYRNRLYATVYGFGESTKDDIIATAKRFAASEETLAALKYARRFMNAIEHDTAYIDAAIANAGPDNRMNTEGNK